MGTSKGSKTGVLGLGAMGSALADALLEHKQDITVWNRSEEKSRGYAKAGIEVAGSAAELAARCDLTIACLTDFEASMAVLASDAVMAELAGKSLVLLSTMSDEESVRASEWALAHGIDYLDGSIMGYPSDVRAQHCRIVYSGSKSVFDAQATALEALGGMPMLVGEKPGLAQIFDKAVFAAYYARCLGLFQGAAICDAAGIAVENYAEMFTGYWDWDAEAGSLLGMISRRDYPQDGASMQLHAAAFAHVAPLSRQLGIDSSLPDTIYASFERALERGLDGNGLAALFEVLRGK